MSSILIIDDDASICETLSMYLSEEGYDVTTASTGAQGLNRFLANSADLVILDIRLPDFDGFAVLKSLQRLKKDVKVIIVSAYSDMSTTVKAMAAGACKCIGKPIDIGELSRAIESALGDPRVFQ
jgi:two-component system response regulator AtoC